MKVRACVRGEVSNCLHKYGTFVLFLAVIVFVFILQNMDFLQFQHKVNFIYPKVSTYHSFCSFYPLSPEDAVEERLLLNATACPETPLLPTPFCLEQTSDPAHSNFIILPPQRRRGQWHRGDQLEVMIKMYDFLGHPKKSGGGLLFTRLHNLTLGAGVAGQVVDHLNGSYSAVFSLLWEGSAQVEILKSLTCTAWGKLDLALDYANHILVTYRCHGPPLSYTIIPTSELHYIANELDGLTGGTNTVVVLGILAHFCPFPMEVYIWRLQTIRRAVMRQLDRAPGTLVVIRTGNPRTLSRTVALTFGDWYSLQRDKVLRAMFKGLNVHLVDAWEMSLAHHLPHNIHPLPPIVKNMIDILLSYICPQKGS